MSRRSLLQAWRRPNRPVRARVSGAKRATWMREVFTRPRYWLLLALWAGGLLLAYGYAAGPSRVLTGPLYDLALRFDPLPDPAPTRVLLVEVGELPPNEARLAAALETLARLGAKQVVLAVDLPAEPAPRLRAALQRAPGLLLAPRIRFDPVSGEPAGLEHVPQELVTSGGPVAATALPPADLGVHRRQRATVPLPDGHVPTLAVAAAGRPPGSTEPLREAFIVNFLRGPHRIPLVRLEEAGRELARSLVEGRHVIVGYAAHVREPRLDTPLGSGPQGLSLLEFQGYALQTLLDRAPIRVFPAWSMALAFTALLSLWAYLYVRLSLRQNLWVTGAFLLAFLGLGAILAWLGYWPPLAELLLFQLAIFLVWTLRTGTWNEWALRRIMADTSRYTRSRLIPASFYATDKPWEYIANLLHQALPLERMVLLERIPGMHRVRVVDAPYCVGEDEIHERRRDFHRTPYTTALANPGPLQTPRPFLKPRGEADETPHYLLALSYAGEVQGFWAFTLDAEGSEQRERVLQTAEALGRRIAEMLYHRSRWIQEAAQQGLMARVLGLREWSEVLLARVIRSLAFVEWRLTSLEQLFHGVEDALVLYDFFGQVLYANRPMESLMRRAHIPFYRMSALELVSTLSGQSTDRARLALARVLVEQDRVTLPVPALEDATHAYRLELRRLARDKADAPDQKPFRFEGVLLVCKDVSLVKTQFRSRTAILERVAAALRAFRDRIQEPDAPEQAEGLARLLDRVTAHLADMGDVDQSGVMAVQLVPLLELAIQASKAAGGKKMLHWSLEGREDDPVVLAHSTRLVEGLRALLGWLGEDARHGGTIRVTLRTEPEQAVIELQDEGYGLAPEQIERLLGSEQPEPAYRLVRRLRSDLEEWGGDFAADAQLGEGLRFVIRLPRLL